MAQASVEGATFRLADEVRYLQHRAVSHDGRVITIGQLVLFSTETGDAWLLGRTDFLAASLARNGQAEPIQIVETAATFAIEMQRSGGKLQICLARPMTRDIWLHYAQRIGHLEPRLIPAIPDFLVIGPPKTGTSWMFANLSQHPRIFMPDGKELRYFDLRWRHVDINTYVRQFEAGVGRLKGEASVTYCLLPRPAIAAIQRLNPAMKLILLTRDPLAQAWSLMKHNFRYGEANFRNCHLRFEDLEFDQYLDNFASDYALSCLDHLGTYRRWRAMFPDSHIWIGTLEEIGARPGATLRSVLAFLGLDAAYSPNETRLQEIVNPGLPVHIDQLSAQVLRTVHRPRAQRFGVVMRRVRGSDPTRWWQGTLHGETLSRPLPLPSDPSLHVFPDGTIVTWPSVNTMKKPGSRARDNMERCQEAVALKALFPYELKWLWETHRTLPRLAKPLLRRVPRMYESLVADRRLQAVLDSEALALALAQA